MKQFIKRIIIQYYNLKKSCHIYTNKIPLNVLLNSFNNNIGREVLLNKDVKLIGNIKIGDYTYINGGYLYTGEIGKFCSMGFNITIGPGEHFTDKVSTYPIKNRVCKVLDINEFKKDRPPIIGNDVWVGNNVTILQGVNIGDGAVIASGSVITKNIEPYSIVAGIPAKKIKNRFTDEQVKKLKKISWWNWEIEKIMKSRLEDEFEDIDMFIKKYDKEI